MRLRNTYWRLGMRYCKPKRQFFNDNRLVPIVMRSSFAMVFVNVRPTKSLRHNSLFNYHLIIKFAIFAAFKIRREHIDVQGI